jgi:flagellar hook-associated protein 1 FlgK
MSDLLNVGVSGLRSYQAALATTSDNIANAGTAGFSRRSTTIKEVTRTNSVTLGQTARLTGNGSYASGVDRAGDAFKTADVRRTQSDVSRSDTGVVWLERIEGALTGNQLSDRLNAFFNTAKAVAADPAATAPRVIMLESAASLASGFAGTGRAIDAATADLAGAGQDAATELTNLSTSLLQVNRGLARAAAGSSGHAQLLDQRDGLLARMSALTDVDVRFDTLDRVTVRGAGVNGPLLVNPEAASNVSFAMNAGGATIFAVERDGIVAALTPTGGSIAGLTDSAGRIAAAREMIVTLAQDFTAAVNGVQAAGRDLAGNPGGPLFASGTPAFEVTMSLIDPRGIAAAAPGEGVRGNGNLADLQALRASGGFEAGVDDLVTGNAAALLARRSVADAQGSIRDSAVAARDAVSGVDLDEEAVDLIRFQQAYQASTRVIQVARDTLQTIFDIR